MDIKTQKMFADIIKNANKREVSPYSTTATVKSVSNGTIYVSISGSDIVTPIKSSSVSVKKGDIVDLAVSHNDTHITGNRSDVAVPKSEIEKMSTAFSESQLRNELFQNGMQDPGKEIEEILNDINTINKKIDELDALTKDVTTKISKLSKVATSGSYNDLNDAPIIYDWAKQKVKPTYEASEIGLDKVGNFKAVSTEAGQVLTNEEKKNARENINACSIEEGTFSPGITNTSITPETANGNYKKIGTIVYISIELKFSSNVDPRQFGGITDLPFTPRQDIMHGLYPTFVATPPYKEYSGLCTYDTYMGTVPTLYIDKIFNEQSVKLIRIYGQYETT